MTLLAGLLVLASVVFYFWRAQFCMETYDEPFYLAPGFHFASTHDQPIRDEILNGPRHFDVLNRFLVAPLLPYSVLVLRRAAVLFYAAILLAFTLLCFRGDFGLTAAVVFVACLLVDAYVMPTWSHNWWCRNFLLLHNLFVVVAYRSIRFRTVLLSVAGVCLGILFVSYNPPVVILPILLIGLYFCESRFCHQERPWTTVACYTAAVCSPIAVDFLYLWSHHLINDLVTGIQTVLAIPDYSGNTRFTKSLTLIKSVLLQKELWLVLFISAVSLVLTKKFSTRRPKLFLSTAIMAVTLVLLKIPIATQMIFFLHAFTGWGGAASLVLLTFALHEKRSDILLGTIAAVGTGFMVGMSSNSGHNGLFWVIPAVVIPFSAVLTQWNITSPKIGRAQMVAHAAFIIFAATIATGALFFQSNACYRDTPLRQCSVKLAIPPYTGLYTNPRRAYLMNVLFEQLRQKQFVLAFPNLPGVILFPGIRSSIPTTLVNFSFPFNSYYLSKLFVRRRFPETLVRVKIEPWTWGTGKPNYLAVPKDDPLVAFSDCAKGPTIVDLPEFEIDAVDAGRVESCAETIINNPSRKRLASLIRNR